MPSATAVALTGPRVKVGDTLPELRIDVTPRTVVMGASSSRDWQPQHHDYRHCVDVANLPDIFLNTPNQAGFIERYLTDWGGPHCRLGKLGFKMKKTIVPGNAMVFTAEVTDVVADGDVTWVSVDITVRADDTPATLCAAVVALPTTDDDNPWNRRGSAWLDSLQER